MPIFDFSFLFFMSIFHVSFQAKSVTACDIAPLTLKLLEKASSESGFSTTINTLTFDILEHNTRKKNQFGSIHLSICLSVCSFACFFVLYTSYFYHFNFSFI